MEQVTQEIVNEQALFLSDVDAQSKLLPKRQLGLLKLRRSFPLFFTVSLGKDEYFTAFALEMQSPLEDTMTLLGDDPALVRLTTFYLRVQEECLKKALEKNPKNLEAKFLLAGVYYNLDRSEEAIKILTSLIILKPKTSLAVSAHFLLATIYTEQKEDKEALPHYEKVVALGGNDPKYSDLVSTALNNLAVAYNNLGDLDRSYKTLLEAEKRAPQDLTIKYNIACVFARKGQFEKTYEYLREKIFNLLDEESRKQLIKQMEEDPDFAEFRKTHFFGLLKNMNTDKEKGI